MTSRGMGYMHKIERKMKQTLYLSILQDEVMKTIERYCFISSRGIFQYDSDPKHTAKFSQAMIVNGFF